MSIVYVIIALAFFLLTFGLLVLSENLKGGDEA